MEYHRGKKHEGTGHYRFLKHDFSSTEDLPTKQEHIERMFSSTRRKLHPLIRMDDLLDPRKSSSMKNIVPSMAKNIRAPNFLKPGKVGVWYNITVALDRERHLSSQESWNSLLSKLYSCIQSNAASVENRDNLHWKVDLFPATNDFVVDHVINEGVQFRKPRNLVIETEEGQQAAAALGINLSRKQRAPMHHEPIYHMYMECTDAMLKEQVELEADAQRQLMSEIASHENDDGASNPHHQHVRGPELQYMDIMYSRWAVQNPQILRQRILEKMGTEVLVKHTSNPKLCST